MSKRPWMPLYIGDYLGDTAHLNAMQHGAYLLLLMHYWANGSLPKDDPSLARIAHVSLKWWLRRYRAVMQQFFDGDWKHKRVELELKKADSLKSLKKKRGKVELVPLCKRKSTNDINAPISHTHTHQDKKERKGSKQTRKPRACARERLPSPVNEISDEAAALARSLGWLPNRIADEWQTFRDYCLAHGKQPKNTMAAWRNWCRSPYRNSNSHSSQQTPRPGSREDRKEKVQHALKQVDAYLDQCDDKGPGSQANKTNARLIPFRKPR